MADTSTVQLWTADGHYHVVTTTNPDVAAWLENLPFTSPDVTVTTVTRFPPID